MCSTGIVQLQGHDAIPRSTKRSTTSVTTGSGPAIVIGILAGYTSVILVMLLGQSRVFYSMSRDGLLPQDLLRHSSEIPHALALQL